MRLDKVKITNFRSIKELTIQFEPKCRVLVGINETGKSNILKALALLDPDIKLNPEDKRNLNPDEDNSQITRVRFVFVLEKQDRDAIYQQISDKVLLSKPLQPVIETTNKELNLRDCIDLFDEGFYDAEFDHPGGWCDASLNESVHKVKQNLKKPSNAYPDNYQVQLNDGRQAILNNYSLLDTSILKDVPNEYLEDVPIDDVNSLVTSSIIGFVVKNLPTCIFWSHSDANLLPGQIDRSAFAADPNLCKPLKYMFSLAGLGKPNEAIKESLEKPNGIRNLLKRVTDLTNKHLRTVWKEYKGIEIELLPNGDFIDATIKDVHNNYNLSLRSDGFRRFITFLLMVSARVKTKELSNTLLLYDEPEISLHPSGARYLRDELIKISKSNYVVFSTHSIFMIDKEQIGRHLLISKKNEITTMEEANESNISDEEVVYKALGYSVFDDLKKINIIFEGWRDKELFKIAIKGLPSSHKSIKKKAQYVNQGDKRR
jgi:AAA ATPase domain